MEKLKIYIATPVNGRSEATIEQKRACAYQRVKFIRSALMREYSEAEFHSSFDDDIAPLDVMLTKRMFGCNTPSEDVVMGRCVQRVMECDAIVLDYGWTSSKGCRLEQYAAETYGKMRNTTYDFNIPAEL